MEMTIKCHKKLDDYGLLENLKLTFTDYHPDSFGCIAVKVTHENGDTSDISINFAELKKVVNIISR